MNTKSGDFTKNLFCLQLQLKTLLEGAGGDDASDLLDTLSKFPKSDQKLAIKVMKKTLEKLLENKETQEEQSDLEDKAFEEGLYQDIVNAFGSPFRARSKNNLSVLDGGKAKKRKKKAKKRIFQFEEFKALRQSLTGKPYLN